MTHSPQHRLCSFTVFVKIDRFCAKKAANTRVSRNFIHFRRVAAILSLIRMGRSMPAKRFKKTRRTLSHHLEIFFGQHRFRGVPPKASRPLPTFYPIKTSRRFILKRRDKKGRMPIFPIIAPIFILPLCRFPYQLPQRKP